MSDDKDNNKKDGIVDDNRDINSFINVNAKTTDAINDFIKESKKDRKESEAFRKDSSKDSARYNREALKEYLERNTSDDEERLSRKKLHSQVDQINTSLEELLKLEKDKKNDSPFDFMSMMPLLTSAIVAALSAANPDGMKPYQTMAKSTMGLAGAGADAIKAAKVAGDAANAAKATKTASDALKTAEHAKELSKAAGVLGTVGKSLGKFSDSPFMKNVVRISSGGMMIGRALEGDALGAVGEGTSLALHEAAAKVKNPKQKALMTAASLGLDAGMIVRDYIRGNDVEKENLARKQAAEAGVEYVPDNNVLSKQVIQTAAMVLPAIAAMAIPIFSKKLGIPDILGGKNKNLPSNVFDAGKASGPANKSKITKIGNQVDSKKVDLTDFKKTQTEVKPKNNTFTKVENPKKVDLTNFKKNEPKVEPKVEKNAIVKQPSYKDLNVQKNGMSLAGTISKDSATTAAKTAGSVAKAGVKAGTKSLPFIGAAMGVYGAGSRAMDGDWAGAGMEIASGLASFVPIVGTGAAVAIQAGLAYRDHVNEGAKQAEEIATITKDGVNTLTEANKATAEQSAVANDMVKESSALVNDSTTKMAGELQKSNISFLDMTKTMSLGIIGFTTNMGLKFTDWVFGADNVFRTAANKLGEVSSNVLSTIKNSLTGLLGFGGGGSSANDGTGLSAGTSTGGVTASKNYTRGKSITDLNSNFGSVSALFESNKGGVGTISSGKGDKGGKSYGKHQLSSASGTMKEFLDSPEGKPYKADLGKYKIGTKQFDDTYKTIAKFKGPQFEKAQENFIERTHFAPVAKNIKSKTGIDVTKRGRAVQELAYSMAVQYRNNTPAIWSKALGQNPNSLSDAQIIEKVMNYRSANVQTHFRNSPSAWGSLKQRISDENAIYKDMLSNPNGARGAESKGVAGSSSPSNTSTAKAKAAAPAAKTTPASAASTDNSSSGKAASKGRYDLDKMCMFALQNAKKTSQKRCAEYVRKAIQAGDTTNKVGTLGDARDWGKSLPKIGWERTSGGLQKGDIAWFPTGMSGYGHVCIWTGKVWVSDFVQSSVQPSSKANLQYHVYRAKSGFSNGTAVGSADVATEDGEEVKGVNAGAEGTEGSIAEESVMDRVQNALTTGVAAIGAALFDNQMARDAVNYFDRATVDPYVLDDKKDAVNMDGFDTTLKAQDDKGFKYKFGDAGVNRSTLFSNEIQRQKAAERDYLDAAGNLGGIVRQNNSDYKYLDAAGSLGGIQRQKDAAYDYLGNAGDLGGIVRQGDVGKPKKKKQKWYDKLFGGKHSDIFGSLLGAFGLGDLFKFGQGVYKADKDGNLLDFGLQQVGDWASGQGLFASPVDGEVIAKNQDQTNPVFTNTGVLGATGTTNVFGSTGGIVAGNPIDFTDFMNGDGLIGDNGQTYIEKQQEKIKEYTGSTAIIDADGNINYDLLNRVKELNDQEMVASTAPDLGDMRQGDGLGNPVFTNTGSSGIDPITGQPTGGTGAFNFGFGLMESAMKGEDELKKFGLNTLDGIMEKNNPLGLGGIYKVTRGALDTKENGGDMLTYGLNTVADIMSGNININPFAGMFKKKDVSNTPVKTDGVGQFDANGLLIAQNKDWQKTSMVGDGLGTALYNKYNRDHAGGTLSMTPNPDAASLSPDYEGRNKVDGAISETNKAYTNMKNNPQPAPAGDAPSGGGSGTTPHGSKSGVGEGLSAALVTRNPDSIFREVSIAVMKATIT